ncbi:MAG: NAD(P)-binding domain-containing protein, partial [Pirellulales bacterium]|nr:NAD(P)-binding domain-containing protein [Pirellulales bacterium]
MPDYSAQLASAVDDGSARIGIIGLGYVGLPLIDAFVIAGFRTLGFDTDQRKIDQLLAGESYIGHIATTRIAELVNGQYLVPTADMTRL